MSRIDEYFAYASLCPVDVKLPPASPDEWHLASDFVLLEEK